MEEIKLGKNEVLKKSDLDKICLALKNGGVIVCPTDTIYGFHALAKNSKGIKKIKELKKRQALKAFIVLVSDLNEAKKYSLINKEQEKLLNVVWDKNIKPTTVILKDKKLLSSEINPQLDTIAIRLPKNRFLIKILKSLGEPLVSTSLNISGSSEKIKVKDVAKVFDSKKIDFLIKSPKKSKLKASRIIDLSQEGIIKTIRN